LTERASSSIPSTELFDIESGEEKTLDFETLVEEFLSLGEALLEWTPPLMRLEAEARLEEDARWKR
jgi:hypothetical protein